MKVIYKGPGPKTYHPVLGELTTGEPFSAKDKGLSDKEVEKYLKSGLLEKAEKAEPKTSKPEPHKKTLHDSPPLAGED